MTPLGAPRESPPFPNSPLLHYAPCRLLPGQSSKKMAGFRDRRGLGHCNWEEDDVM